MKLLLVIDHLSSGGAQRQLVELGCGLAQRGHAVELFDYFPKQQFFLGRLVERGITVHGYPKGKGFSLGVIGALSSLLRRGNFDLAVSFLNNPNLYAEIASVMSGSRLVVSERCSHHDDQFVFAARTRRLLHLLADHVVTNSQTHAAWLRGKWWLDGKVSCIYNGLDLTVPNTPYSGPSGPSTMKLLAVGRICPQKNAVNLILALRIFFVAHGYVPEVSWAGKRDASPGGREYGEQIDALLSQSPEIAARWHWLGERSDMHDLLQQYHALVHPSLYEGLPNAVCEALAAGLPVLASNVGDHGVLIEEGERGFLFDPEAPESIAAAIEKAAGMNSDGWLEMSRNSRAYAEGSLGAERMVDAYERLFAGLSESRARTAAPST